MPIYGFRCKACDVVYEELLPIDKTGKYKNVKCPQCQSKKKERTIDATSFSFVNPVGTDRWNSDTQGHGYRFHHNLPNVIAERENAQKKSHMGEKPYNEIDDISGGKYFGEVK
jgi:putative FmdB family regulatory protein